MSTKRGNILPLARKKKKEKLWFRIVQIQYFYTDFVILEHFKDKCTKKK